MCRKFDATPASPSGNHLALEGGRHSSRPVGAALSDCRRALWRRRACGGQDGAVAVYVVGAGGAGRETLDVAMAAGIDVTAFVDDRLAGSTIRGLPVVSPDEAGAGAGYVIGIANPTVRRRLAAL